MTNTFLIGGNGNQQVHLNLRMGNRHGLIAGATGTGKTVTLQVLAEGFAKAGVPVFMADIKGDLSGLASSGKPHAKIDERIQTIKIEGYQQRLFPLCVLGSLRKKRSCRSCHTFGYGTIVTRQFFSIKRHTNRCALRGI